MRMKTNQFFILSAQLFTQLKRWIGIYSLFQRRKTTNSFEISIMIVAGNISLYISVISNDKSLYMVEKNITRVSWSRFVLSYQFYFEKPSFCGQLDCMKIFLNKNQLINFKNIHIWINNEQLDWISLYSKKWLMIR